MHMPPAVGPAMPDAGFFGAVGHRLAEVVEPLHQPHVTDDRHVAYQPHVGAQIVVLCGPATPPRSK